MEATKPLTYDSLRAVLQQMEANKRFQVSLYCPSIRPIDRGVPLKLKHFCYITSSIVINDTLYRLGAYRKYEQGVEIPAIHQLENDQGGYERDLDKFGLSESFPADFLTPGDIFISHNDLGIEEDTEVTNMELHIKQVIEGMSDGLAHLERELEERKGRIDRDEELDRDIKQREEDIAMIRARLQPYLDTRDKRIPPFEVMTQLTVSNKGTKRIERYKKTQKLPEMMKHLLTFLLGKRRHTITLNFLSIPYSMSTLRLPPELKFKTKKLRVGGNMTDSMDLLRPILEDPDHPLDVLDTGKAFERAVDLTHPWIKNARNLILRSYNFNAHVVATLVNPGIHYENKIIPMNGVVALFEAVLRKWASGSRKLGVFSHNVKLWNVEEIMNRLAAVAEEIGGQRLDDGFIKVPTRKGDELHVIFTPSGAEPSMPDIGPPGTLKITVVARDEVFVN